MTLPNGYKMQTTFMNDFAIADAFGNDAIKDTFKRAFNEWKDNVVYGTELCAVMNLRCWYWYEKGDQERSKIYADFYYQVREYCLDHYKGDDFTFFYNTID